MPMFNALNRIATLAHTLRGRRALAFGGFLALAAAVACSSSSTSTPVPQGPQLNTILVTQDLTLGKNRVAFGIIDEDGLPVRGQEAQVRALYLSPGDTAGEVRDTATAKFVRWPSGAQGVFSAHLEFNTAGNWRLEVEATTDDGRAVTAQGAFQVFPEPKAPGLGQPAPASVTPTVDDVDDLSTITSSTKPDPDLYRLSVHEALAAGKPLVVVFATPAFCVSAACGPQVEIVSELKERFSGRANFIHVEVFENPHLIEGGRPTGGFVGAVAEWKLPTEPLTFVVDEAGLVRAKFEGFATLEELDEALGEVAGS